MRLIGLALVLVLSVFLVIGLNLMDLVLGNLWLFLGILGFRYSTLTFSFSICDLILSWKMFFKNQTLAPQEHSRLSKMHRVLAGTSGMAGVIILLALWVRVFCTGTPPQVEDFGQGLLAPFVGLLIAWVIDRPLAGWHQARAKRD